MSDRLASNEVLSWHASKAKPGNIFNFQEKYAKDLKKFNMLNYNSLTNLMFTNEKLSRNDGKEKVD